MLKTDIDFARLAKMHRFRSTPDAAAQLPPPLLIERRWESDERKDQGKTSQCAAYAMCHDLRATAWQMKGHIPLYPESGVYAKAQALEYESDPNAGTSLFAIIEAAAELGYIEPVADKDMRVVYDKTGDDLREAICRLKHRYGYGVLIGLDITEDWNNAGADGWIPDGKGKSLGGHAVAMVCYRAPEMGDQVDLANSWGAGQGWRGFNRMTWKQFEAQHLYSIGFDIRLK